MHLACGTRGMLPSGPGFGPAQEFMEAIERNRTEVVEKLVKKYRTISPLLGKIEEVWQAPRTASALDGICYGSMLGLNCCAAGLPAGGGRHQHGQVPPAERILCILGARHLQCPECHG